MPSPGRLAALPFVAAAACGPSASHVRLQPVPSGCPRPAEATSLIVTAMGDGPEDARAVPPGAAVDLSDFPAGTRQLQVEVLGGGGAIVELGRTAPLVLDTLADGATVPLFMAPPDDGCVVGELATARDLPLVVAAGEGALVVGGRGADGPVGKAEWYDPALGAFRSITTPAELDGLDGAVGMTAATMPDGRVVLTGGGRPIYVVFDPATRTFAAPRTIAQLRAHHAAVALDASHVLIAGGCEQVVAGVCSGAARKTSFVLDIDDASVVDGPDLAQARVDGIALLEPLTGQVLLAGGSDGNGAAAPAERIDPAAGPGGGGGTVIAGAVGVAAPLVAGSALTAFAADGVPAAGTTAIVVPGADTARAGPTAGARTAPTLTPLEDGDLLVLGGDATTPVARYHPATGEINGLTARPLGPGDGHGAARLPDGTVLVVGGHDASDAPLAGAWVFRPLGADPFTGATSVTPSGGGDLPLVPLDPSTITASPYTIAGVGGGDLAGRVVIAGMMPSEHDLTTSVQVTGAVDVLFGIADPDHLDALELAPGAPARLTRHDAGVATVRCHGEVVSASELTGLVAIAIHVRDGTVRAEVGGRQVLDCPLPDPRAGLVGLAAPAAGDAVTLSTLSVTR